MPTPNLRPKRLAAGLAARMLLIATAYSFPAPDSLINEGSDKILPSTPDVVVPEPSHALKYNSVKDLEASYEHISHQLEFAKASKGKANQRMRAEPTETAEKETAAGMGLTSIPYPDAYLPLSVAGKKHKPAAVGGKKRKPAAVGKAKQGDKTVGAKKEVGQVEVGGKKEVMGKDEERRKGNEEADKSKQAEEKKGEGKKEAAKKVVTAPVKNEADTKEEKEAPEKKEEKVTTGSTIDSKNVEAFIALIGVLIFFTVAFEFVKGYIIETFQGTDTALLVHEVFAELTVLGFLALITFILGKCGLQHLSLMVYGHADVEEDKERLSEILEQIHMVLFLVMCIFIFQAIMMVIASSRDSKRWLEAEGQVLTYPQRVSIINQFRDMRPATAWEWMWGLPAQPYDKADEEAFRKHFVEEKQRTYSARNIEELINFMLQRERFRHEGSSHGLEAPEQNLLDDSFNFSLYLQKVKARRLADIVGLPIAMWLLLLLIVVVVLLLLNFAAGNHWEFVLWLWVTFGWAFLAVTMAFNQYVLGLRHALSFDLLDTVDTDLGAQTGPWKHSLIDNRSHDRKVSMRMKNRQRGSTVLGKDELANTKSLEDPKGPKAEWITGPPRFYEAAGLTKLYYGCDGKDDPPQIRVKESCVSKCLRGGVPAGDKDKLAYNIYVFGKNEVRFHEVVFRLMFLLMSVHISVFCIQIAPAYLYKAYSTGAAVGITLGTLGPTSVVLCRYVFKAIQHSVMSTSGGPFRSQRILAEVEREQKERRAVLILRIMATIQIIGVQVEPTPPEESDNSDEDSSCCRTCDDPCGAEEDVQDEEIMTRTRTMKRNKLLGGDAFKDEKEHLKQQLKEYQQDAVFQSTVHEAWKAAMDERRSSLDTEDIMKIFDSFDTTGDLRLCQEEFKNLFTRLGAPNDPAFLHWVEADIDRVAAEVEQLLKDERQKCWMNLLEKLDTGKNESEKIKMEEKYKKINHLIDRVMGFASDSNSEAKEFMEREDLTALGVPDAHLDRFVQMGKVDFQRITNSAQQTTEKPKEGNLSEGKLEEAKLKEGEMHHHAKISTLANALVLVTLLDALASTEEHQFSKEHHEAIISMVERTCEDQTSAVWEPNEKELEEAGMSDTQIRWLKEHTEAVSELVGMPHYRHVRPDDNIYRLEFLNWMAEIAVLARTLRSEHVAELTFLEFEKTPSHTTEATLTIEELQETFSRILGKDSQLTYGEVSALILQLDKNDDGEFDQDELAMWIDRHSDAPLTSCKLPCGTCCNGPVRQQRGKPVARAGGGR